MIEQWSIPKAVLATGMQLAKILSAKWSIQDDFYIRLRCRFLFGA